MNPYGIKIGGVYTDATTRQAIYGETHRFKVYDYIEETDSFKCAVTTYKWSEQSKQVRKVDWEMSDEVSPRYLVEECVEVKNPRK